MSGCLKQFGRLGSLSLVAGAFLLLSAPQSVSIADDDIKALERKLELLKKKASRKTEYKKMRGMLEVKLKEVQDQIQMLDEEYKDVAKSAPAPVAKHLNKVSDFEKIMEMMAGADIRYERSGHYSDIPFELKKKGDKWVLTQMQNLISGTIKGAGTDKILFEGFGPGWTILGTWKFKKTGDRCRIDHTLGDSTGSEPMKMEWDCKK